MHSEKEAIAYMVQVTLRTPIDIGAIIKDRRRVLGINQAELAERIGVGRLWINQVERGKPGASLGLVLRALSALELELIVDDQGKAARSGDLGLRDAVSTEMRRRLE